MSIYFAANPEYYNFIRLLENEGEECKQLHHKIQAVAQQTKDEFKKTRNKINTAMNTIKPPTRGLRSADIPNVIKRKPEKRAATNSTNFHSKLVFEAITSNKSPAPVYHDAVPARTNGAQRILNPKRLLRYKEYNREPPLLIGKGVNSVSKNNPNMASTSLSSYNFDIVNIVD